MAGNLKDVRIVTFAEPFGRYTKGEHAMHKSVAEKLVKNKKAKVSVKEAKPEYEKRVEAIKAKKAEKEAKEQG